MNDYQNFINQVNNLLSRDKKYEHQINKFINYIKEWSLECRIFNLTTDDIDQYFIYSIDSIVGFENTLISHISALKLLFNFLADEQETFKYLLGYINTTEFLAKQKEKVEKTFSKPILSYNLICLILNKLDLYISNCENKKFSSPLQRQKYFEMMISRIYIKLSLIMPLKTSQMLDIKLFGILTGNVRMIEHNGVIVKLPNSLREQIIETIRFAQEEFSRLYTEDESLFGYLYTLIGKEGKVNPKVKTTNRPK